MFRFLGCRGLRLLGAALGAWAALVTLGGAGACASAAAAAGYPALQVLSTRADLVSGGDALVAISLPAGVAPSKARVLLGGRDITSAFALRPDGRFEGLVTGLKLGANRLAAIVPGGHGASLRIVDHPLGGPVFAGPQPEPWTCQPTAIDSKCDQPASYTYLYKPAGSVAMRPYDPAHPPSDVAMTTTQTGATVPFIVREETGYEDRDQYRIEVLYQPGKPWSPWAPQPQWNHKLYVMHGFNCYTAFKPVAPPWGDASLPGLSTLPGVEDSSTAALGMGFAVMSTALDNSNDNCNVALQAESIEMAKEHLIDDYGPLAYTIGFGCSGGSLA